MSTSSPSSDAVTVNFFASLQEQVGHHSIQIEAHDISSLLAGLERRLGAEIAAELRSDNVRIAVNQELISTNVLITAADEIAFLPPVTGG